MDIELVQYINTLLAEKQRKVEHRNKRLNEIEIGSYTDYYLERHFHELQENDWELSIIYRSDKNHSVDPERMVVWGQELSWERHMIYRCQKAMDYIEEEY